MAETEYNALGKCNVTVGVQGSSEKIKCKSGECKSDEYEPDKYEANEDYNDHDDSNNKSNEYKDMTYEA